MLLSEEQARSAWLSLLISLLIYFTFSYQTSFAFERPVHSGSFVLALTGAILIPSSRLLPSWLLDVGSLEEDHQTLGGRQNENSTSLLKRVVSWTECGQRFRARGLRITFITIVLATSARVVVLDRIVANPQCCIQCLAPIAPILLALYESKRAFSANRRTIFATTILCLGTGLSFAIVGEPRSYYICARNLSHRTIIPRLQIAGTLLDTVIMLAIRNIVVRNSSHTFVDSRKVMVVVGWAALSSSLILLLGGIIIYTVKPGHRYWILGLSPSYAADTGKLAFAAALTAMCAIQMLCRISATSFGVVVTTTCLYASISRLSIQYRVGIPPISSTAVVTSLTFASLGLMGYYWDVVFEKNMILAGGGVRDRYVLTVLKNKKPVMGVAVFLLIQGLIWNSRIPSPGIIHPIEALMAQAGLQHDEWASQGRSSRNLNQAAQNYFSRYGRNPPPRFDMWHEFASSRESLVVDDFDGMAEDLLPFWGLSPSQIRERTWEAIANPWNEISGIIIRDGKVEIAPGAPSTHYWMVGGLASMIQPFAEWLPDMDLAINLNDECRVAMPHKKKVQLHRRARDTLRPRHGAIDFSTHRASSWRPLPDEPIFEIYFQEHSWQHTFQEYGSIGCPSWSPARHQRLWDFGKTCITCTYPHTLHGFVKDWSRAADPCHQPDLASLHGLHLSPASFKITHELIPVFSQSKAHGYNDILYPSAWNYIDKAIYAPNDAYPDPPFAEKEPTLFWRGATSEGVSHHGTWKGMTRQRLVHLFNNASESEHRSVILPTQPVDSYDAKDVPAKLFARHRKGSSSSKWTYTSLPPSTLHANLNTSIHFVSDIARCAGDDCGDEYREFCPQYTLPSDFQEHWRYKYLFDLDGAGFSGRFLPFLQSNSLVLKAGLMREWWEGRVKEWVHFVPVDVRLQEVWSILAFFAGWKGEGTKGQMMKAHETAAIEIASKGKDWANKVLRKEDMEIYMFRLLLEWGRLTDDNRDTLGWREDNNER